MTVGVLEPGVPRGAQNPPCDFSSWQPAHELPDDWECWSQVPPKAGMGSCEQGGRSDEELLKLARLDWSW